MHSQRYLNIFCPYMEIFGTSALVLPQKGAMSVDSRSLRKIKHTCRSKIELTFVNFLHRIETCVASYPLGTRFKLNSMQFNSKKAGKLHHYCLCLACFKPISLIK